MFGMGSILSTLFSISSTFWSFLRSNRMVLPYNKSFRLFVVAIVVILLLYFSMFYYKTHRRKLFEINRLHDRRHTLRNIYFGNYQCNRYSHIGQTNLIPFGYEYEYTPKDTMMASCKIENLCLSENGDFVLFQSHDRILNDLNQLNVKPWVYVQGSTVESDRGNFYIKNLNGDLVFEESNGNAYAKAFVRILKKKQNQCDTNNVMCLSQVEEQVELVPISLSSNFTFFEKSVFALQRFAAGNVGHIFSESLAMIVGHMLNFHTHDSDASPFENHILFLDDIFDVSGDNWRGAYKYDPAKAEYYSLSTAKLLSNHSVLQLCKREGVWKIEKAPCRSEVSSQFNSPIPTFMNGSNLSNLTLQSCFSNIYLGHTLSNLVLNPYGKEGLFMKLRELVYKNLNLFPFDAKYTKQQKQKKLAKYLLEKDIIIAINRKDIKGRHGQALSNADELKDYFQQELPKNPLIQQFIRPTPHSNVRKLRIETLDLGSFASISEQIKYFSDVDVYISDPGSAAYYSLFLREDTSAMIAPTCKRFRRDILCQPSHGRLVLSSLPHVQVLDILELNGGTGQCRFRPALQAQRNCDFVSPKEVLLHSVLKALRKRYRLLMT
ncbi:hypothetical protein FDP41_010269 [Naegleria fowleri]|uniref:Glycosyltransferase 61 catalytic domain-containing protein n=1 Tax=Naegleria fowleri TaxID=5763 RepID=A0A6A5C9J2_NAEFO|nr:uncharacterized protein FDP41_010269 [Naegleria fowleri]KAF0983204.1 hypothetical protein FDP41_010269 [Naegleria fowleri]